MNRRAFLNSGASAALVGGLTGTAFAGETAPERVLALEADIERLRAREPAPAVQKALVANGLAPSTLNDVLVGLMVAHAWGAAPEEQRDDPAWEELVLQHMPRFTERYGALLDWMGQQPRLQRRLFRRPNKAVGLVAAVLFGNPPRERMDQLRQALAGLRDTSEEGLVDDAQLALNEASATASAEGWVGPWPAGNDEDEDKTRVRRLAVIGLLLVLGGLGSLGLGVMTWIQPLCVVGVACIVVGIALLVAAAVKWIKSDPFPRDALVLEAFHDLEHVA